MQFISRRPLSEFLEFVSIYTYKLYSNYFLRSMKLERKSIEAVVLVCCRDP